MQQIVSNKIRWPSDSIIRVKTSDDQYITLQAPILRYRWPLFRDHMDVALQVASELTKDELQAVLLYVYSDLPAKRSLIPVFQRCELTHPSCLQESTFVDDMRALMNDKDSADFTLLSSTPKQFVRCHRPILAARSKYFRSLFSCNSRESAIGHWRCKRGIPIDTLEAFIEYLYTGQISSPRTVTVIPLCWVVKYLRLSGEKEVENIVVSVLSRELNASNESEIYKIASQWEVKCVKDVVEKFRATRGQ